MIRVPLTLDSHGLGLHLSNLGTVEIINDGTGSLARGNYIVRQLARNSRRVVREARVENWPRKTKSAVQLLAAGLKALGHV